MSVSPQFRPDEPNALLRQEHALFVEMAFETVTYGVIALLYILTLRNLILSKGFKSSWKMILFLTIQQIAIFIAVTGNFHMGVLSFVYNRNIPGGPVAFQNEFSNLPYFYAALAGNIISAWLQDVLLIYRFIIIWGGAYYLLILPGLIFLASIAFSLILLIQVNPHPGLLNSAKNLPTFLIYLSLSVGLNVILTFLIAGRLYWYRRRVSTSLGTPHSKHYISIAAMLIESASLYTVVGLAQIISLRVNPTVGTGITGLSGNMTALAPLLIAYRVSVGQGWTRETAAVNSTHFNFKGSRNRSERPSNLSTTVYASTTHVELQSRGTLPEQKVEGYMNDV